MCAYCKQNILQILAFENKQFKMSLFFLHLYNLTWCQDGSTQTIIYFLHLPIEIRRRKKTIILSERRIVKEDKVKFVCSRHLL